MKRSRSGNAATEQGKTWPEVYPTLADEQHLFNLWTNASLKQSKLALIENHGEGNGDIAQFEDEGAVDPEEADAAEEACMAAVHDWCRRGWYYDPCFRRFSPFLEGLHSWPEYSYMLFKPSSNDDQLTCKTCVPPSKTQKILSQDHPGILERGYNIVFAATQSQSNAKHLKRFLLRNFDGALPQSIAYFQLGRSNQKTNVQLKGLGQVCVGPYVVIEDGSTSSLNRELSNIINIRDSCVDLVVINLNRTARLGKDLVVDRFFPAYPIALTDDVFIFTPLQLAQLNGLSETNFNLALSVPSRIMCICQAMLVCKNDYSVQAREVPRRGWEKDGMSSHHSGIRNDGRVLKIRHHLSYYAAPHSHGWLSTDTRTILSASCKLSKAKTVLELGTWYGLSTNHIAEQLLMSSHGPTQIFTVDAFPNVASFGRPIRTVEPIHKMFYNYLRLETAHRNLQASSEALFRQDPNGGIYTVTVDCHDAPEMLSTFGVVPDLVFMDCEKDTERLATLLEKIHCLFPETPIVGDDYVFPSVREAISSLPKHYCCIKLDEAYVILPDSGPLAQKTTWKEAILRERDQLDRANNIESCPTQKVASDIVNTCNVHSGEAINTHAHSTNCFLPDEKVMAFVASNLSFPVQRLGFTETKSLWKCCSRNLKLHDGDGSTCRKQLIPYMLSQLEQYSQLHDLWCCDERVPRILLPIGALDLDELVRIAQYGDPMNALELAGAYSIDILHHPLRGCPTARLLHEICHSCRRRKRSSELRASWNSIFADVNEWGAPLHNSATLTPFDLMRFEAYFM
eukprot:gb/GECG01005851.1/.p1 GENE.gb/GECG01005851.1/~~gb/GECG01005851.1/.p1  ORF type:complete len:795 (+),score=55.60 gb/GECG01005851.1/:1-2385(+)